VTKKAASAAFFVFDDGAIFVFDDGAIFSRIIGELVQ
jgi:hypothetical protein